MPKLVLPVPETVESVTRPIIFDITRQVFKMTGLPTATRIQFPGDIEAMAQPGSALSQQDNNAFTTPASNKIKVEVEEQYEADRILSSAVYRPEELFIFRDDRVETYIKPAYSSTDITLNFSYRSTDKTAATRWRDDIKTRVSMGRMEHLHDITYHYLIPKEFLVILQEIHRLREQVAGYGEDYDTYFRANLTQRASLLANMSGTHQEWGISEKQMRIVGWFDFEGVPELGSKEDETDTWTITFAYKFKFDKPVACVMQYPLVIHNQLLSAQFRPTEPAYQVEHHQRSYSHSAKAFSQFEKSREIMAVAQQSGISIPTFDEFIPSAIVPETIRVFTTLVTIDDINPTLLFSLRELGKWRLDDDVLEFMVGEAPYMTRKYESIFTLNLYQSATLIQDGLLQVDADLNVLSTKALPLRYYYHVRLGIVTDFTLLSADALRRAREFGSALLKIIDGIDPSVKDVCKMVAILGNQYVTRNYLQCAIDQMNRGQTAQGNGQIYQFNTVQSLMIEANKKD